MQEMWADAAQLLAELERTKAWQDVIKRAPCARALLRAPSARRANPGCLAAAG